jgi:hypothetical protein
VLTQFSKKHDIGCAVEGHYAYHAYAAIHGATVTTKPQTDEDIAKEIRNKNGKLVPEQEEDKTKRRTGRKQKKKERCQFPL